LLAAIAGFALFSLGDAITKTMIGEWSSVAVAATRFALGALFLGTLLAGREGRSAFIPAHPWWQMVRGLALAVGTICFFSAVFVMPLTSAIASPLPRLPSLCCSAGRSWGKRCAR